MFPPEDVMHKSIATEHIKLQMKFIVKSRLSPRRVSVFISFINQYCSGIYFMGSKSMGGNRQPTLLTDIRQEIEKTIGLSGLFPNINGPTKSTVKNSPGLGFVLDVTG